MAGRSDQIAIPIGSDRDREKKDKNKTTKYQKCQAGWAGWSTDLGQDRVLNVQCYHHDGFNPSWW